MKITWNELTGAFDPETAQKYLGDWNWLVGHDVRILLVSALGELFLQAADGSVLWLESGAGRITPVAPSSEQFQEMMRQSDRVDEWFCPQLIGDLITSGKTLKPGQCYSYTVPPILSGSLDPDNIEPTDLSVHFSIMGQICKKALELPEGTRIKKFTTEEDDA